MCWMADEMPAFRERKGASESRKLAAMWPDYVCIEKRMGKEAPFIISQSPKPDPLVFDSCLGCGATTIGLKKNGVRRVLSNEIDWEMQRVAYMEALRRGVPTEMSAHDWRDLTPLACPHPDGFDIITCLGNSMTLLFDKADRLKALRNFASILDKNGVLIIDERNYPKILEGRFSQSGEYVYCGLDKVMSSLIEVTQEKVVMEYQHLESREKSRLAMYPFKRGELLGNLVEAGFTDILLFGDYERNFDPGEAEFITYAARK
jgi:glycine/sarcosine N-methyltransferase